MDKFVASRVTQLNVGGRKNQEKMFFILSQRRESHKISDGNVLDVELVSGGINDMDKIAFYLIINNQEALD